MRGGRNKFGPLYRRYRQIKQQQMYPQVSTAPFRIKMETTQTRQPTAPNDLHLMRSPPSPSLSPAVLHQSHMYSLGMGQSGASMSMNEDMVLTTPSLTYSGPRYRTFPGFIQEKREMPFCASLAPANYTGYPNANNPFTPRGIQTPSPCSTSKTMPVSQTSNKTQHSPSSAIVTTNFMSRLLEGEQDESQLCAKVLATLQREQASRGKHDCLNTFSIMCKMADQTLFGLVEWARNSALFKELKVVSN